MQEKYHPDGDASMTSANTTDSPVHVVIGGTGGIGSQIARRLAAGGAPVHLVARDADRLSALAEEIGATHAPADATDHDALGRALDAAPAGAGFASLPYAVGSIPLKPMKRTTAEDFRAAFEINLLGAAMAVQPAAAALKRGGGSVVLFSTVAAQQGFASHAAIAAAKGAVEGLTRALAAELAPKVRVNCIAPSLVRTPLAAPLLGNDKVADGIAAMHPLGRLGEPDDVAVLADLLLAPDSSWISGQVIGVDGGRSSLRTPH